jgi:hypothetical protein
MSIKYTLFTRSARGDYRGREAANEPVEKQVLIFAYPQSGLWSLCCSEFDQKHLT